MAVINIDAIGLLGPGLDNWSGAQDIFRDESVYDCVATQIPPSTLLPSAERRRVGSAVKLAMAAASDALSHSAYQASDLLSVFSSSGGDGDNCHSICEALASDDRLISPTKFTNSVHNAPSGYWGISCQARPASTSLCAFDGSFSAGFLEASALAISQKAPVLFVAYDTPYPEPLRTARPIEHSFGVALVLNPVMSDLSFASLQFKLAVASSTLMQNQLLELLRLNVPAARGLPLLKALASGPQERQLVLELFTNQQLVLDVKVLK